MNSTERFSSITVGSKDWLAIPAAAAPLERLVQALDDDAQELRATVDRRTMRVTGTPAVIVKNFRLHGLWRRLKLILRGDPTFREWTALRSAPGRRIPVPRAVAVSQGQIFAPGSESFLVTEELSSAVTLGAYLYGKSRSYGRLRRRVIEEAGRTVRLAHDAGMLHRDLHLGNLMIRNRNDQPEIFLIDLQRVSFRHRLGIKARVANLAVLHGGCGEASRSERLRFLNAYLAPRPAIANDLRTLLKELDTHGLKHRHRLWRSRGQRCLADNRDFVTLRSNSYAGCVSREWSDRDCLVA